MAKPDPIKALGEVLAATQPLEPEDRQWVFASAMSRLGMAGGSSLAGTGSPGGPAAALATPSIGVGAGGGKPTAKAFYGAKRPASDVQRVAVLAYYATHYGDMPSFKTGDLTKLNVDAAGLKINMTRAVNNATNRNHYLTSAGGGRKQLTSHGEAVVNALPDQEAVKKAEAERPTARRPTKGRKRAAKKQ